MTVQDQLNSVITNFNNLLKTMTENFNFLSITKANNSDVVHKTGDETVAGTKTFNNTIVGSVNGNANTATNDIDGNPIKTTYQKVSNLSQVINESETNYPSNKAVKTAIDTNWSALATELDGRANISLDNLSEAGLKVIKDNSGSGLEVCDIGIALYVDETKGLRRYLNGQVVGINTNTQAFLNRLQQITTLHPSLLCTEEEWQTAKTMSAFGQVGKFVFNYSGDEIISVRIPAIVNVQGLFDLQNLGMTVAESLPNITGYIKGSITENSNPQAGGAFKINHTYDSGDRVGQANWTSKGVDFNASRSSSTYQDNAPVQQEAIQYPYFIQIATGSETENNIINEIELNNPFSLFDSKYSDHELNNLSWLKSAGQLNAKAVYPTAYDKILENVNNSVKGFLGQTMYMWGSASGGYMTTSLTPVVGSAVYNYDTKKFAGYVTEVDLTIPAISLRDDVVGISYTNVGRYTLRDESSSVYITDYDFVLNTADETFRLPLKNGEEHTVSGNAVNIGTIQSGYVFDRNCVAYFRYGGNGNTQCQVLLNNIEVTYFNYTGNTWAYGVSGTFRANRGDVLTYTGVKSNDNMLIVNEMVGNGSLYFYIGETVQNANLIDAGMIGEQLANKQDKCVHITETYQNGTSWYRVWSDGWCEQGGVVTSTGGRRNVTLLKPYSDGNYNVQQTILNATANGQLQPFTEAIQFKTSISFSVYCDSAIATRMWKACGYMRTTSGGTSGGPTPGGSVPDKT